MANYAPYFAYWGKTSKKENIHDQGDAYHLLPYHCLDVAAVAAYWWDHSVAMRRHFCCDRLATESEIRAWLLFFTALHDLGKWDIRFQCKVCATWLELHPEDGKLKRPSLEICRHFDHGVGGLFWFIEDFQPTINHNGFLSFDEPSAHPYASWFPWIEAVTGHHGYVRQAAHISSSQYEMPHLFQSFAARDKAARWEWIKVLELLFLQPASLTLKSIPPKASTLLAGFCSVSDWLGSWRSEDTFQFCATLPKSDEALKSYFTKRYEEDAALVIERSGLLTTVSSYSGTQALLEKGYVPRQLQILVDEIPVASGVTLIEAPTGSGKTETALAYAWKLLDNDLADSIIFALPTQATANAMLERMGTLALQIFEHPNIVLAHGNADFNPTFKALKHAGANPQGEEAWSQCCEWLSQGHKRVFLGQVGVCTIDQVLVSVLPVRHRFIRGLGTGRSVLIVDEVHAYDSYMNGLLDAVLSEQLAAGGSAILLSATLSAKQRQRLLSHGKSDSVVTRRSPLPEPYPLISWCDAQRAEQLDLQHKPEHLPPAFQLYLEALHVAELMPDSTLIERMVAAARSGAQVCIICNLVDVAQRVFRQIQAQADTDIQVMLFHARFTLIDRQKKERGVLSYFGKKGDRSCGRILVSTQVIEASLDVCFDWLITQLCPVDHLFQRLGRLHRHKENWRPAAFSVPKATVLLPDGDDYGAHNLIYSHTRVMWRTQQYIEALGDNPLVFPLAYRGWIEPIYDDAEEMNAPEWVTAGMDEYQKKEFAKRHCVRLMLDWAENTVLTDDDQNVRAVTRDGEMSLPIIPYVMTSQGKCLLNGQLVEQLDNYLLREALMLNRVGVPHHWEEVFTEKVDEDGLLWLEGNIDSGGWQYQGKRFSLTYTVETGMVRTIPAEREEEFE